MTETFTLEQVFAAMEKNGYPKSIAAYVRKTGTTIKACAIGQAALNLGTNPERLGHQLATTYHPKTGKNLFTFITDLNDRTGTPVDEIARIAREEFSEILDNKVTKNASYR